jgi:hypothetical protein
MMVNIGELYSSGTMCAIMSVRCVPKFWRNLQHNLNSTPIVEVAGSCRSNKKNENM